MIASSEPLPPKGALLFLRFCLPEPEFEAISGDLLEEFYTVILPSMGQLAARRWFWLQVLASVWPLLGWRIRVAFSARRPLVIKTAATLGIFERAFLSEAPSKALGWAAPVAVSLHLIFGAGAAFAHLWNVEELPEPKMAAFVLPGLMPKTVPTAPQNQENAAQKALLLELPPAFQNAKSVAMTFMPLETQTSALPKMTPHAGF